MRRIASPALLGWLMLWAARPLAAAPVLGALTGTSPEFVVSTWQMVQGLPSDKVRAVLQTRDGYLWVATFNGVAQFDGVRFRVFNDANTPELRNSLVSCLFEDAEDRLWIGSDTGEITWRDNTGFHALTVTNNWPNAPIDRMAQSEDGMLWVLSREGFVLAVRDLKVQRVVGRPNGPLYSDIITELTGQAWGVRYGGTVVRVGKRVEMREVKAPAREKDYRTIAPARSGGFWVRDGTRLRRWYQERWVEDRGEHSWGTRQAVVLYETAAGEVWVGTRDDGAFMVKADGSEYHINRATGLTHDLVSCISEDREGNLWIGSDAGGLNRLRPRALFMVSPPDQWQHRPICSVSPSQEGGLWVGTQGAGLYKLQGAQFTWFNPSNNPVAKDICTAVEDRDGRLWVGTEVRERMMNQMLVWDRLGHLAVSPQASGLLVKEQQELRPLTTADTRIEMPLRYHAIFQARDGALWLGGDNGLACLRQGQWSRLGTELYRPEVRCITETPDGAIWLGMRGGGVSRCQDGRFTQFLRPQGLPYDYAWAIHGDSDGSVWIGTPGAGLLHYQRDGRFVSFTTRQGLPSDFICSIQSDAQDQLWLGSHAGVLRLAKAELHRCARGEVSSVHCFVLDSNDGLASLEMAGGNQPAACTTSDGRLWFATSGGLAMVDPARIRTNSLPPPVWLEELVIDRKVLPLGSALAATIDGASSPTPTQASTKAATDAAPAVLRVPPGSSQFELHYTALSFCASQRVRFRYRLEGVDSGWVEAGARRSAYYAHLAPGTYRFQVIACNNDGVWNESGAAVVLSVLPYFWQTWWFAPGCWLGGISLAGTGVITLLRRRHGARVEALERARLVERERGRIARDLHDDLGSGLTDIGMTSGLGQDPSVPLEEAREYFREINQRSNEMVMALDEIVWAVNPKNDHLVSLAIYFSQFAERFVRRTPIRCRFSIPKQLPQLSLNAEQRHSLFLAFKEALQNAVRHSAGSSLRVNIALQGNQLDIAVEDDGCGFEPGTPAAGADGLRNMRERLEQVGGRCEIVTAPGKGTRVTFHVPLGVN